MLTLFLVMACQTDDGGVDTTPDTEVIDTQNDPMLLEHEPVQSPWSVSTPLEIRATISDDSGILQANVYIRNQLQSEFDKRALLIAGPDQYAITIQTQDLVTAGMQYYIEAISQDSEISTLPEAAPANYFKFDLVE